MRELSETEFDVVSALPGEKRYEYFVKKAADWDAVWALGDEDTFTGAADAEGRTLLPVWPHRSFAEACALDEWKNATPVELDLSEFKDVLEDLRDKGSLVAVFQTPDGKAVHVDPGRLVDDLAEEVAKYE